VYGCVRLCTAVHGCGCVRLWLRLWLTDFVAATAFVLVNSKAR